MPFAISRLKELKVLQLGYNLEKGRLNYLTSLPNWLGQLTNLQTLDLCGLNLSRLPHGLGQLTNLQTLDLRVNNFSNLPDEMGQLTNLQTLYLSSNNLSSLPDSSDTYIAPQLLRPEVPAYKWDSQDNLQLRYRYPVFMPRGILSRAIVRLHQRIEQQTLVWRSGVVLHDGSVRAELLELRGEREIRLRLSGRNKRDFLMEIVRTLDDLHQAFPKLHYEKLRPCNCATCSQLDDPHFFDLEELRERWANGKETIECRKKPYENVLDGSKQIFNLFAEALMDATSMAMLGVRGMAAVIGLVIVAGTVISAIKTFVLPRGVNVWLTRIVFGSVGAVFRFRSRHAAYAERDQLMAMYAPVALVTMPIALLSLLLVGYMFLFWAVDPQPLGPIFKLSGSSLLTLGNASVDTLPHKLLEFSEAMIGLVMVALLIAYLPTIYAGFSRREAQVALWEAWADSPPTAFQMISRAYRTGELRQLREVWLNWQSWFAELEESHTSLASLAFFRSPKPDRSWITAAGSALDAAALVLSTVDVPWEPRAAFCIRTGYLSLRHIANFFGIDYDADPQPDDPISINRDEFESVCDRLYAVGVPLKVDREQAWRDFSGWRVNYDSVLLALATLTMAPYAPWISDRSIVRRVKDGEQFRG